MFFGFHPLSSDEKQWRNFIQSSLFSQKKRIQQEKALLSNYKSNRVLLEILPPYFYNENICFSYDTTPLEIIGGDLLDFLWIDKKNIGFYLFDIAGHDETSGEFSLYIRKKLAHIPLSYFREPHKILNFLNQEIGKKEDDFLFVTMWCGSLNLEKKILSFSSAGSPPALWVSKEETISLKVEKSPPLGIDQSFKYKQKQFILKDNGFIYIMTDGTYEIELKKTGHYLSWDGLKRLITQKDYLVKHNRLEEPTILKNIITELAKEKRLLDDFSLIKISLNLFKENK